MNGQGFADRMAHVGYSGSLAVIARVRDMREKGIEVIDFGQQGETPDLARRAAAGAMNTAAASFYTDPRGLQALRRTIAEKLLAENGIATDPESNIVVTVGAKQGIFAALLALVDREDEVLLDDPGYVSFEPLVRLAGAIPVPIPLAEDSGFRIPIDDLRRRVTPRTRLLILCNPHNPTGRCLSRAELSEIGAVAREGNFRVLVDEAYEHFVYDGTRHVSMASLPGMMDRTITIQTVSKVYNMAGWRIGWVAAPADIIRPILAVHTHAVTCPTSFAQAGAEAVIKAGIGEGNLPIAEIVARYARQRTAMVKGLRSIPGVTCVMPEGAYFVFPNVRGFGLSSVEMAHYLLENAQVATTPGSAFGAGGEGHLRMVFKTDIGEIHHGLEKIAAALAKLHSLQPS